MESVPCSRLPDMNKRRAATIVSTVALLGLSGTAAAGQPNSVTNPTDNGGAVLGSNSGVGGQGGGGSLPFTGFEAGLVLIGGAGIALTGLALRRFGHKPQN
jgi:hypothetical protein